MGIFNFKKPSTDRRLAFGSGPNAKAAMKQLVDRVAQVTGIKCSVKSVGKEFWAITPEGTTPELYAKMIDVVKTFYVSRGVEFSNIFSDDDVMVMSLEGDSTVPTTKPEQFGDGPWTTVMLYSGQTFTKEYTTWHELVKETNDLKRLSTDIKIQIQYKKPS